MSAGGAPGGGDAPPPGVPDGGSRQDREDVRLMWLAVSLGRRGAGRVHPNPRVGCVIVQGDRVVGRGWHREFGGPHAEVEALADAGDAARGATAYVSLEPCRHEGKTPACTTALVRAGVRKVVYGAADPTVEAGGGADDLRQSGIEVVGPTLTPAEARRENGAFYHTALHDTPWLVLKLALSLDGGIAARPGERTALTGPESRVRVHALRARFDAVMVGARTARSDDPLLTVREDVPCRKAPARVVLDPGARLDPGAALFRDVAAAPVVVFVSEDAPEGDMEALEAAGASVHPVPATDEGLHLDQVLRVCRETGLRSVLCEGGGRLARALLAEDRVERMHLFTAPRFLGAGAVPAFPEVGALPARGAAHPEAWEPMGPARAHGRDVEVVWERLRPWSHGDDAPGNGSPAGVVGTSESNGTEAIDVPLWRVAVPDA